MARITIKHAWSLALLIKVILCETSLIFALDPQKTINQYGHDIWLRQNGLPANGVNTSLQTRNGFLWLGTTAGLFRFDGVQFTEVSTDAENSNNPETVSVLCESRDSTLWIGTTYSGLRRFKNGKISSFSPEVNGLPERQILALFECHHGHLWVGTSYGLFFFDGAEFTSVPINPNYITGITQDTSGRIWIGTHDGVRIFDEAGGVLTQSITMADGLPNNVTTVLFGDTEGDIWIGTADGLVRWRNGSLTIYTGADGLPNNHISAIFKDRDSNIWVGTFNGLGRLTNGRWSSYTTANGLSHSQVLSISEDREGSLWVGTMEGLDRFKDVNITPYTIWDGLGNDYVSGIVELADNTLCFFSNVNSTLTQFKDGKMIRQSLPIGPAYSARDNSLWIAQTGTLTKIKEGKIKTYGVKEGFPTKWISAITEDDQSLIVYVDDIGVLRFIDGRLQPYLLKGGKAYSSEEYVECFYFSPEGVLWIGTTHGLVRIRDGESTLFGTQDGMVDYWVSSIFDDRMGSLWISSAHGGVTRYQDGKFTVFTAKTGIFTNEIYNVLCDEQGDLWLSSPRGIGYVSRQDVDDFSTGKINAVRSKVYTVADGMKSEACFSEWQPAALKAHDGRLWFTTKKGAVMIDPKTFKRNQLMPPVIIDNVAANQEKVLPTQHISFSSSKDKFEFHYSALSFLVPERVLFKYKLEGYDDEWVDAGTRRVAYYTNLPPGNYTFRVIACNNDGLWNRTGASFAFTLKPHFYETFWFYGLVLLAVGGIVFGVYRFRVVQLLKREKELQVRVQEALANIKTLGGLIPICAHCKKIRNDKGYWDQLEGYIQTHTEAKFSHGLCPDCAEKLYPELYTEEPTQESENLDVKTE